MNILNPTPPTPLTPQQQLAAQVAADELAIQKAAAAIIGTFTAVAKNIYANSIGNGTAGQTFGPQDYFNVMGTDAGNLPKLNVAFQGFLQAIAAIAPPTA